MNETNGAVATPETSSAPSTPPVVPPAAAEAQIGERNGHASFTMVNEDLRKEDFQRLVPEEYKDAPWVQNLLKNDAPTKELFKQFGEAQKLIGSRPQGIIPPDANSTPEQVKSFYKSLGVPDDISQYVVEPLQWDETEKAEGELITKNRRDDVLEEMKKTAQENGLTPKQFKAMVNKYEKSQVKVVRELQKSQQEAKTKQDTEFDAKLKAQFGENADKVIQNGRKLIDLYVPENVKGAFKTFDNEQGLAFAVALNNIHNSLVKSETFSGTNGMDAGVVAAAETLESVRAKTRSLMAEKSFTDMTHPDYRKTQAQVKTLQDSLGRFFK